MEPEDYIRKSMETYLFWLRIMKEHAIFIESSLPPTQSCLAAQAKPYRLQFGRYLKEVISLANGILPQETLSSGQFYTNYTEAAEQDFHKFYGMEINTTLTVSEYSITPYQPGTTTYTPRLWQRLSLLNRQLLKLLASFIEYQTNLLKNRYECNLTFGLYPSALNHLLRETKRFEEETLSLQISGNTDSDSYISFWNQGMAEHSKSLRGQLDWTEEEYFRISNDFANIFDGLAAAPPNKVKALEYTPQLSTFAQNITQALLECRLKGILSSLYADHLLREVNHYNYQLQH
jgi:hypothetical protein